MPPLDFPNTPAINDTWTGANGVTYVFDGTKWIVSGSSIGPYLLLAGGSMTGPIALAADPITDPQAANKHYVDVSINLAGNYLGTWAVASNTPNISAGGSISNANYVATTSNPAVPETVPVGVPGIAGMTVANGDRVIWASGLGTWQILRNAGVTLAAADARYYAITNPSGYQTAAQVTAVLPVASSTTPVMDGTATIGVGTTWARADHIHPTDTTRYAASNPSGYQTAGNVTTTLAPYALLASPPLTGNPTAPTPTAGDNDTSIATTAFVQGAVRHLNYADNSGFSVNQRGYVSGTALGAGAYAHDRWKAGAGGCTYTFTQSGGPATTVTITAGTLQQIVEGASLAAGTYMLSWTGTAQGRVGASSYAASPVTVAGVTAGANTTIEFNTGTLGQVKLEGGTVATPWIAPGSQQDLAKCQRFYQVGSFNLQGYGTAGIVWQTTLGFPTAMRALATVTSAWSVQSNCGSSAIGGLSVSAVTGNTTVTAAGQFVAVGTFTASADL